MVPIDLQAEEVVQPADRSIPAAAGHGTGDAAAAAVRPRCCSPPSFSHPPSDK